MAQEKHRRVVVRASATADGYDTATRSKPALRGTGRSSTRRPFASVIRHPA
ncbi:hypothetical protein ACWFRM_30385 [Streptomyces sp. NPDC055144]